MRILKKKQKQSRLRKSPSNRLTILIMLIIKFLNFNHFSKPLKILPKLSGNNYKKL